MTEPENHWKYTAVERVEREVAMYLDFEEDLTLDVLRSFVTATEHLDGDSLVSIVRRMRGGSDLVTVLVACKKTAEDLVPNGEDEDQDADGETRPYDPDQQRYNNIAADSGAL
ncbi:hypothetical protein [Nocardia tengchongensis]|uniref:hypothetical protein n=1 Tax=Nocardia tengchongensis TaxID=2055889 RepID=UPI0036179E8B